MASSGLQALGIALCLLGLIGALVCCVVPRWKQSSHTGSSIVVAQSTQEGIWMSCVTQSTGQVQCKAYDSLLGLPGDIQAARALTVVSIALCAPALLASLLGADFTTCVGDEDRKGKVASLGGALFLLAGVLLLVPVCWSAHTTISQFHDPRAPRKLELGLCVWVGWAASGLLLLGGALLCCSWPRAGGRGPSYAAKYINNPSGPARTHV